MSEMSEERLAEIEARGQKATPDWMRCTLPLKGGDIFNLSKVDGLPESLIGSFRSPLDADFAVHARTDIPDLLAENTRLRAELAAQQERGKRLEAALDLIPAALMLLGGPPYRVTFTEDAVKQLADTLLSSPPDAGAAPDADGWNYDMSTAPKDRNLLLSGPGLSRADIGSWDAEKGHDNPDPYWYWGGRGVLWARGNPPIAWREVPLPAPPKQEGR